MIDEEIFQEWVTMCKLRGFEKYDCYRHSAEFKAYLFCYRLREAGMVLTASMEDVCCQLYKVVQQMQQVANISAKGILRTPVEIKKDIKREKNPMRLKQLNKELNDAYKSRIGRKKVEHGA